MIPISSGKMNVSWQNESANPTRFTTTPRSSTRASGHGPLVPRGRPHAPASDSTDARHGSHGGRDTIGSRSDSCGQQYGGATVLHPAIPHPRRPGTSIPQSRIPFLVWLHQLMAARTAHWHIFRTKVPVIAAGAMIRQPCAHDESPSPETPGLSSCSWGHQ